MVRVYVYNVYEPLYLAVVMYMCTAGLTAAAHVYTLYALYPYSESASLRNCTF